jgi:hypothetical protein
MPSKIDIFNLALLKLAQDATIASFVERSKESRVAARLWEPMRDLVLAERQWPWAMRAMPLALTTEAAMPGWRYRYARPADCISVVAVTDENGVRAGRRMAHWCNDGFRQRYAVEYEVAGGEQGASILADIEQAYLIYVARIEDTERFPPQFVEVLACKLAEEAAPAIIGDRGFSSKPNLKQLYQMALSQAAAHDYNEGTHDDELYMPAAQAARG